VIAAAPDLILASWCGKKVVPGKIRARPGWDQIPAVRNDRIVEIKSALILQPGPAALTDGLDAIVAAMQSTRGPVGSARIHNSCSCLGACTSLGSSYGFGAMNPRPAATLKSA
jgi:hypothetical protein